MKQKYQLKNNLFFLIFGAVYFSIFSNLEVNVLLKSYLLLFPIQIMAIIYATYIIVKQKI